MLDRKHSAPLYEQLKNEIQKMIKDGDLKPDDQIPSERELVEQYNVSRITVRQAINLAEKEGLVKRVHGVGTFVAKPKIKQELSNFNNFESTLQQQGLIATTKMLGSQVITSDFQLSRLLDINVMERVIKLELIGYGDEIPVVYYNSYFPNRVGEKMKQAAEKALQAEKPFSTLDLYRLDQEIGLHPTHVEQTFEAQSAHYPLTEILNVQEGFPLFRVTSIVYQDKTPLEYKETYYRGDKYKFFITRHM
ncbi:GntR family transcriptional regulator [Fictibacillus phosphorivorans]|uniref:GntR family transcriptional regulator n=1 Tax=Fictibacillus phosphorivorans TaxID=1221500 RepID=UPI00203BF675|nr:GntR family transcriptional regulator [Fictibacillus phosphorivorans]MCM3717653.1 GntR family transcriptional regulator [Fictibacillus phosphorivorans]MCM3775553.1 GntR family transcriptional regulator [Fictibacillus phosphorivorans]